MSISAEQQSGSAVCIHISPPSWTSLSTPHPPQWRDLETTHKLKYLVKDLFGKEWKLNVPCHGLLKGSLSCSRWTFLLLRSLNSAKHGRLHRSVHCHRRAQNHTCVYKNQPSFEWRQLFLKMFKTCKHWAGENAAGGEAPSLRPWGRAGLMMSGPGASVSRGRGFLNELQSGHTEAQSRDCWKTAPGVLVCRCGNTSRMVIKWKEAGSRSACVPRRVMERCHPSANRECFDVTFNICLENSTDRGCWWATVHGSQRVGHNRVTNTFTLTLLPLCSAPPPTTNYCAGEREKKDFYSGKKEIIG